MELEAFARLGTQVNVKFPTSIEIEFKQATRHRSVCSMSRFRDFSLREEEQKKA